jgi:hypothetical protein
MNGKSERAISLARKSPFLSAFVEDLVRLPNHNAVIPKSFVTREPGSRFLHFSRITRCESFLAAMH